MFSFSSGWFATELIEGGGFVGGGFGRRRVDLPGAGSSWFEGGGFGRRRVDLPGAGSSWFEGGGFGRRRVDRRRVAETTG
ncbi:hypothetical protein HanIR_Chr08g0351191 [Helianthus annuus]|nr:hypothetical protein HanIR_Chr08g0351191 [Helianthus annuus]